MRDFASCYNEHAIRVSEGSTCTRGVSCRSGVSGSGALKCSSSSSSASAYVPTSSVRGTVSCVYRSKLSSTSRRQLLITVTWAESGLGGQLGLSISVGEEDDELGVVEQQALRLTRAKGNHSYTSAGGLAMSICWDLSSAKYVADVGLEPVEGFYIAVEAGDEAVLVLGDMNEAEGAVSGGGGRAAGSWRLVSRREQYWIENREWLRSWTRTCLGDEGGDHHEIWVECKESELSVCVDGRTVVKVGRLRWNFRGNQTIFVDGTAVDMMWDVHDWWFGRGARGRHAVFTFRTRTGLESRPWLEGDARSRSEQHRRGFSLLLSFNHASCKGILGIPPDLYVWIVNWKDG